MKKILNYIWNNTNWMDEKKWLGLIINRAENIIYYYIEINQRCKNYIFMIFIIELLQGLISIVVFMLLYKYDIKLIPNEIINVIIYILYLFFILFVMRLIILWIYGVYLMIKDQDYELIEKSIKILIRFINFIINVNIIYWLLDLKIELFLQYNIILVIDIMMIFVFYIYKNVYDYEIKGKKIVTFLQYPWILIIIIIIILRTGKIDINYYMKYIINEIFNDYCIIARSESDSD